MTKPDTKEIFEIAYAFKTAQWGTPQPIRFLPQAHKFGEDVLNLIEAYDEAQKRITELEEVTANHCDLNQDRVLRLEALLREILGDCHSTFCDEDNHHYCDACDKCHDNVEMIPHRESCVFKRIQKELGEG